MKMPNGGLFKMPFRKKVTIRIWSSVALTVVGIILFTVIQFEGLMGGSHPDAFVTGFYAGLGGGLIGAGIVTIIKNRQLLKNPERFKAAEVEDADERIGFIMGKTYAVTFYIGTMLVLLGAIIAVRYSTAVAMTLLSVSGVYSVIMAVSYQIIRKRY